MKVIFDFGANVGQNLDYYLQKAERVIAVEANPELCKEIVANFQPEISQNKLRVVNAVIAEKEGLTSFWLNLELSVLSQLDRPSDTTGFRCVKLPGKEIKSIVAENLNSNDEFLYTKFDLEGYDYKALTNLFRSKNFPKYVSVEVQTLEALAVIVFQKHYEKFKLVDGASVAEKYRKVEIKVGD